MEIAAAIDEADYRVARELLEEYAASLGFSLCFQGFDREIEMLPQMYGPPTGVMLLAHAEGRPAGCVALRPAGAGIAEMKRLYVRPAFRGTGLGRLLAETVIEEARRLGYGRMVLDTMPSMDRARAIYRALGFEETVPPPGGDTSGGTVFMATDLTGVQAA